MPDTLRIGLLGPLQVRDGTGRIAHVGGRQLRVRPTWPDTTSPTPLRPS
jgi:hypothetical protein